MSAFIVSNKTINTILSALQVSRTACNLDCCLYLDHNSQLNTTDLATLGQNLFDLNVEAVEQRYGQNSATEFRNLDYKYEKLLFVDFVQPYKSTACLLYQCSEGDVPQTKLFHDLMEFYHALAHKLASSTPEYKNAAWD